MSDENKAPALDDEADLVFVRDQRKNIVKHLTKQGVPEDTRELSALIVTLDGIDKSALSRMRTKSMEKSAGNVSAAASIIANMLGQIDPKRYQSLDITREIPTLPNSIKELTLIEGETDLGTLPVPTEPIMNGLDPIEHLDKLDD